MRTYLNDRAKSERNGKKIYLATEPNENADFPFPLAGERFCANIYNIYVY